MSTTPEQPQEQSGLPTNPNSATNEVRAALFLPGNIYKTSLARLVSKIVDTPEQGDQYLHERITNNFMVHEMLSDARNAADWKKSLHDEANFQFSSQSRPVVEAVLNGIDSQVRKGDDSVTKPVEVDVKGSGFVVRDHGEGMTLDTILTKLLVPKLTENTTNATDIVGRFGVGFYSLLGYIQDEKDVLVIRTNHSDEAYRVSISKSAPDPDATYREYTIAISPLQERDKDRIGQGSEVEVRSKAFDKTATETYLKSTLGFKTETPIAVNGEIINDVSAYAVTELPLPTGYNQKQRKARILESESEGTNSEVVLGVAGVVVERFQVSESGFSKNIVVDIPPGDNLPKSRDKVEVNKETVYAIKETIDAALKRDIEDTAHLLSALAPVVEKLQERNPFIDRDMNMNLYLQQRVKEWIKNLPADRYLIPASANLKKVVLPGSIAIDSRFISKQAEIPGLEPDSSFQNGILYWAPFTDPEAVLVELPGTVLMNERLHTSDPRRLGILNAYIEVANQAKEGSGQYIEGHFISPGSVTPLLDDLTEKPAGNVHRNRTSQQHYEAIVPESDNGRERLQATLRVRLPERIISSPVENEPEEVQTSAEDIERLVQQAILRQRLQQKGIRGLISRFTPADTSAIREQITVHLLEQQRSRKGWEVEKEVKKDYTPQSVGELQTWIVKTLLSDSIQTATNSIRTSYRDDLTCGPEFWQGILDEGFVSELMHNISPDQSVTEKYFISQLPQEVQDDLLLRFPMDSNQSGYRFQSIVRQYLEHYPLYPVRVEFTAEEWKTHAKVMLALQFYQDMQNLKGFYFDTDFLSDLTEHGQYADEMNQFLHGQYSSAEIGNLIAEKKLRGLAEPLMYCETTHEKRAYMEWVRRNKQDMTRFVEKARDYDYSASFKFYSAIYNMGIDSEDAWEIVESNMDFLKSLRGDKDISPKLPKKPYAPVITFFPPLEYLCGKGLMYRANIPTIVSALDRGEITDDRMKYDYWKKAIGYSSLPPEIFSKYNDILYRMHTERDPGLLQLYARHYRGTKYIWEERNADSYFSDDGFESSRVYNYDPGAYKLQLDTSVDVLKRIEVLERLPAEYAILYHRLLTNLDDPHLSHPSHLLLERHKQNEERLQVVFTKLAELPQQQSFELLLRLTDEIGQGMEQLQARIGSYEKIDRDIRPWLMYLVGKGEKVPVRNKTEFFEGVDNKVTFSGSDLVARYFTSDDLQKVAAIEDIADIFMTQTDKTRAVSLGQRRIEHAANYQSTQGYAWLRELVQNAYNVTRNTDGKKEVSIQQEIEGSDFVISVEDPGGMSLQKIVTALLIPQKSEWDSTESIGYFGHGFFTVFKEADEVRLKTSVGDGKTTYVRIKPQRKYEGKVVDLSIEIGSKDEEYKGTSVSWVKKTDFQDFEASRARAELTTYAGLLPEESLAIRWNNETLNKASNELLTMESPLGQLRFYLVAGENTLTQNGLFVKDLDQDVLKSVPESVKQILLGQGICIDIPAGIKLIDSRADIARKEEVLPQLQQTVAQGSVRAAASLFISGQVRFDHLPYDFFDKTLQYVHASDKVTTDVKALVSGQDIDWTTYTDNPNASLQLLVSLPALSVHGTSYSIIEAVAKAQGDSEFKEQLPFKFSKRIVLPPTPAEIKVLRDEFSEKGFKVANIHAEDIPSEFDSYQALLRLQRLLLTPSIEQTHRDYRETYYASPQPSIAQYTPIFNTLGWNLFLIGKTFLKGNTVETLARQIAGKQISADERQRVYQHIAYVGSHEYQHVAENSSETWTHNTHFFTEQQRWLANMLFHVDIDQIDRTITTSYTGGYISPAEFSQWIAKNKQPGH